MSVILAVLILLIILLVCYCLGLFDCGSGWRRERLSAPAKTINNHIVTKVTKADYYNIIINFSGWLFKSLYVVDRVKPHVTFKTPDYMSAEHFQFIKNSYYQLGLELQILSLGLTPNTNSEMVVNKCYGLVTRLLDDVYKIPKNRNIDCIAFILSFYIAYANYILHLQNLNDPTIGNLVVRMYTFVVNRTQMIIPLMKDILGDATFPEIDNLIIKNGSMHIDIFWNNINRLYNSLFTKHDNNHLNLKAMRQTVHFIRECTGNIYAGDMAYLNSKNIDIGAG